MPDDPPRTRGAYRPQKTRAAAPAPLRIEERDLAILAAIAEHRFLTGELLLQLFPPDAARTPMAAITAALAKRGGAAQVTGKYTGSNLERRLRLLFHHGLLDRVPRGLALPYAYALSARGRALLRKETGRRAGLQAIGPSERLFYVEHALMVARFRIALGLAIAHRPELELVNSQRESRTLRAAWTDRGVRRRVNPDGFFLIRDHSAPEGRNARAYFLECDRGTMTLERLLAKFEDYAHFEAAGQLGAKFGISTARIVTVAGTDKRAAALLTVAAETESKILDGGRDGFLFTSEDAYRTEPTNVLAQIFRAADKPSERAALIPSPLPRL